VRALEPRAAPTAGCAGRLAARPASPASRQPQKRA
jgi:hypothetical protein